MASMEGLNLRRAIALTLLISLAFTAANTLVTVQAARTYFFTATISPTEIGVNQLITFSMTIANTGNSTLGSIDIAIPVEFTNVSNIEILNPSGWSSSVLTAAVNLTANGGYAVLQEGENVTFTFNAAAIDVADLTTWAAEAYSGTTKLTLQGGQPTVKIVDYLELVAPEITATPSAVTQNQPSTLTSTLVTTGTSPYTYQWFQKAPDSEYTIVGGNSSSFIFPGSATTGNWSFLLQVTDDIGAQVNSTAVSVTVFMTPTFTINVTQPSHGTIIPGTISVPLGGTQDFTVSADPGYEIADVLVDGTSIGATTSYVFTDVAADHNLEVALAPLEYTLTVSVAGSGTVAQSQSQTTYHYGDVVQLTAVPAEGWRFSVWSGDLGGSANPSLVIIDGNEVITATFLNDQYAISAIAGTGGSISPLGVTIVNYGGSQVYIITPNEGYRIVDVLVNNTSAGPVSSFNIAQVTGDTSVTASFAPNTLAITASAGPNGSINPNGNLAVAYGSNQGFIILAGTGYHVSEVLVDGVSVGAVASYTFTNVITDHSITANFAVDSVVFYSIEVVSPHGAPTAFSRVNAGGSLTASVTSPEGNAGHRWICTGYSIDGGTPVSGASYTFNNVQGDHTITFNWQEQYYLTVISLEGSTTGTGWYNVGATATVSVPSNTIISDTSTRQIFIGWTGDATGTGTTSNPLTVDSSKTVTATWKTQYQVTFIQNGIASGSSGTVVTIFGISKGYEQLPNVTWIDAGDSIAFSYAATVESNEAGKQYTLASINSTSPLTIDEPTAIQAIYEPQMSSAGFNLSTIAVTAILLAIPPSVAIPLLARRRKGKRKITPIVNEGGSISPSTVQLIERGGDSTVFIIMADLGYRVADVVIDKSIHLGPVRTYKFSNVTKNHKLSAIFHKC